MSNDTKVKELGIHKIITTRCHRGSLELTLPIEAWQAKRGKTKTSR